MIGFYPVGTNPVGTAALAGSDVADATESLLETIDITDSFLTLNYLVGLVIDGVVLVDGASDQKIVERFLAEDLNLLDALDANAIAVLIEQMQCSESFTLFWEALAELNEQLDMRDYLSIFLSDQLDENVTLDDLWSSYGLILTLQDLIRISGVVETTLETNQVIAETLAMQDLVAFVLGADLSESINLTDEFQDRLTAVNHQLDGILISSALDYSVTVTALIDENMVVSGEFSSTAEMLRLLDEGILVGAKLTSDTGVYEAWTMNTMTGGATLYDNFPFNSFALHTNKKYLGAMEDGIYELTGADDDGTEIDAGFKTGLKDFGSTLSKRMVDAWFTMSADGDMLLKTTTVESDGKVERWYLVKKTPRMHRAKMARGVKAMFWQFELTNINGEDFDVDNLVLHPLPLNRRY